MAAGNTKGLGVSDERSCRGVRAAQAGRREPQVADQGLAGARLLHHQPAHAVAGRDLCAHRLSAVHHAPPADGDEGGRLHRAGSRARFLSARPALVRTGQYRARQSRTAPRGARHRRCAAPAHQPGRAPRRLRRPARRRHPAHRIRAHADKYHGRELAGPLHQRRQGHSRLSAAGDRGARRRGGARALHRDDHHRSGGAGGRAEVDARAAMPSTMASTSRACAASGRPSATRPAGSSRASASAPGLAAAGGEVDELSKVVIYHANLISQRLGYVR